MSDMRLSCRWCRYASHRHLFVNHRQTEGISD